MGIPSLSLGLLACFAPLDSLAEDFPESRIMGGEPAKVCAWPTTVSIRNCTATLIHPEVIIYAAHCGGKVPSALFGESTRGAAKEVPTKYCVTNPKFKMAAGPGKGTDFAFCVLKEAVKDIPIAPILYGCEAEALVKDAVIWLAGFGKNDGKSGGARSGVKHRVETDFVKFRNSDKKEVVVGSNGKTACNGDSGGPAFIKLKDGSWRTFGITSHGEDTSCTKVAYYTYAPIMVPWMQKTIHDKGDTHIDVTPCFEDDGSWKPSKACGGFATDYDTAYGKWENFCSEGAPLSKAGASCGDPHPEAQGGSGGEEKSGSGPEIAFEKPLDQSEFDLGEAIEVEIKASGDEDEELVVLLSVNGKEQAKDDKAPYTWTLEELKPGVHKLSASAEDSDGNQSKAKSITIEIKGDSGASQNSSKSEGGSESPAPGESPEKSEPKKEPSTQGSEGGKQGSQPSGAQFQNKEEQGGCSLAGDQGGKLGFWGLALLLWGGGLGKRRLRSRGPS